VCTYSLLQGLLRIRTNRDASLKCHFTLLAKVPPSKAYPVSLVTLGDLIRKRRLDVKLLQKDVAGVLGVNTMTVNNGEKVRCAPILRLIPRLAEFLGYEPTSSEAPTCGAAIKRYRQMRGINQKKPAENLGVDQSTLAKYGADKNKRCTALGDRLKRSVEGELSNIA
jgi:transcriptional regulator with XRE-family HTH domain